MRSSGEMLHYFLDMVTSNPLLGGVLLAVPGGRINVHSVQHFCTVISPAVDPQHFIPWVDLEASLLTGRRIEKPGLLQRAERSLLVLQRSQDLEAQAAQYITQWFDATPLAERPAILAVVDDSTCKARHWLDCRLAFRLQWEAAFEPQLSWPLPPSIASEPIPQHELIEFDESLLHFITTAAAIRGLNDPRYAIMATAAAHAHAKLANRAIDKQDVDWAVRYVLDSRANWHQTDVASSADMPTQNQYQMQANELEAPPAVHPGAGNLADLVDPITSAQPDHAPASAPKRDKNIDSQAAGSVSNERNSVSPSGKLAGESFQFIPVAPTSGLNSLKLNHSDRFDPMPSSAAGRTVGRFGNALPNAAGRLGRRFINHSTKGRIDLAATLRAAVPWQRLRATEGRRIRIYPQDLRYRQRERRPGTTYFILLDASASMWARHLSQAKNIALHLTEQAYRSRSRIALIGIRGSEPKLLVPPSRCYNQAYTSILGLEVGGSTPLVSALHLALSLLTEANADDKALVYILTDGRSTAHSKNLSGQGTLSVDDAIRTFGHALIASGAEVTVIGTAPPGQDRAARHLANALNGSYQGARTARQLIK